MRFLLWVLCLVIAAPSLLQAQALPASRNPEFRWPLDVQPVLVSSFGEFRPTHLHAGLDLSTGGRSGLKCYAVGDGWIARMRMSPFGYGKALYLQLDVGPLVVYAHLSRFAGEIADRAWAEQLRRKGFSFDVYLQRDEVRVRRGDVIAWSGATGIGHPHLHFEVRDGDVARNPQTAGFAVRDKLAPTIRDVSILPLSVSSQIEGGFEPQVIPASGATKDRKPLRVSGELGFAVQAFDKAVEGPYRQAPYRYEVRVDGRTLYSALHERFDYAHNHHSKLDYDQDRLVFNNRRSMQLFARRGNRLHGRSPARGGRGILHAGAQSAPMTDGDEWFHVDSGEHLVEISVHDVAGNSHVVALPIVVDALPEIGRLLARRVPSGWEAMCVASDDVGIDSVLLSVLTPTGATDTQEIPSGTNGATGWTTNEWQDLVVTRHADQWTAALPAAMTPPFVLRAIARDDSGLEVRRTWGEPDPQRTIAASTSSQVGTPTVLEVTSSWRRGRLKVSVESTEWLMRSPQLVVEDEDGEVVALRGERQLGDRRWVWQEPLASLPDRLRELRIEAQTLEGVLVQKTVPLKARIVRRHHAQRVDDLMEGWELDVETTSFFDEIAIRMQEFDSADLPLGRELLSTGVAVAMESREAPTNRRVRVRYRPPTDAPAAERGKAHTGLFYVDRSGSLQFLSAEKEEDGALVGRARYLTVFAVLEDRTPPRLEQFKKTRRADGEPRLQFRVTDVGADLGSDALSVTIDDTLAIPEWDPETTRVLVHPTQPLSRGTHTLRVVAVDRVGNRSERTWSFTTP